jgi:urea transport system ATP-binding protein
MSAHRYEPQRRRTLALKNVTVTFDHFKALDNLTLTVEPSELRCVIGPNGAGKTTMMDVVTGKTRPESGSVRFGPHIDLLALSEPEIAQAGIGRKFQKPTVFERLSVFENLELALSGSKSFCRLLTARLTSSEYDTSTTSSVSSAFALSDARWQAPSRMEKSSGSRLGCC